MKKFLKIFIVCILCLPLFIKANGLASINTNYEYKIKITKSEGFTCNNDEEEITLENGKEYTVINEQYFEEDNIENYNLTIKNDSGNCNVEINIERHENIKDFFEVIVGDETYKPTNSEINSNINDTFLITDKINIYSVPSVHGKLIGNIPANIIIDSVTTLKEGSWFYIEYDGQKGWINNYSSLYRKNRKDENIISVTEINYNNEKLFDSNKMLDDYFFDYNSTDALPTYEPSYKSIYLKINDKYEKIEGLFASDKYPETFKSTKDKKLYSSLKKNFNEKDLEVIATIPKNTGLYAIFSLDIGNYKAYYVKYNNMFGWMLFSYDESGWELEIFSNEVSKVNENNKISKKDIEIAKIEFQTNEIENETVEDKTIAEKTEIEVKDDFTSTQKIILYSIYGVVVLLLLVLLFTKKRK